jgi:hypothetical protein
MVQFECLVREGQDLKLTLITTFPITSTRIINDQRKEAICLEDTVSISKGGEGVGKERSKGV